MSEQNPIVGTWYSSVGSKLVIEHVDENNTFHGGIDSTQDASGCVPVVGAVASADGGSDYLPVAFTASWPAGDGYGSSVTSYTGQYSNKHGQEQIEVIFIIADKVCSTVLWQSTGIASDLFKRTKP